MIRLFIGILLVITCRSMGATNAISIPLTNVSGWHPLDAVANRPGSALFGTNGLRLNVNADGVSMVHMLPRQITVSGLRVVGRLSGQMKNTAKGKTDDRPKDFYLRIGLIEPGQRRLSWLKRMLAPDWVEEMEALVPKTVGLGRITFHSFGSDPGKNGRTWKGKFGIRDRQLGTLVDGTEFNATVAIPEGAPVMAIWVFADGDGTDSRFQVQLQRLELLPAPAKRESD